MAMVKKLGDIAVGTILTVPEVSGPVNYVVVQQDMSKSNTKYYAGHQNTTWLMRLPQIKRKFGENCNYKSSDIHEYLSQTFVEQILSPEIKPYLVNIYVPYEEWDYSVPNEELSRLEHFSVKSGKNGLLCSAFLPSIEEIGDPVFEYGYSASGQYSYELDFDARNFFKQNIENGVIDYDDSYAFRGGLYHQNPEEPKRSEWGMFIADFIFERGESYLVLDVYLKNPRYTLSFHPIVVLSKDTQVVGDSSVVGNQAPNTPSSITVPQTIQGGASVSLSWSVSSDLDSNLEGYIVERSYNGGSSWSQIYQGQATSTTTTVPFGTETVMFRVCAYDTYGEKSGWRTSANKTVVNNRAPAAPPSISVPLSPAGGDKLTVTWTASSDVDGNLEGYELERQWDGSGAFTRIYKGAALSYQDSIPKGTHSSVVYRVRAYDSFAAYSSYTTSPSRTIDNNTAPAISCDLSGDLGTKSEGFTIPYTVSDAERQEVTVTEKVGNLVKRTYKPTLGQQNTFEVTGEYFQKILNGAQTVQIVATDSAGKSSTLSLTFTKAVHRAVITLSEPLAVEKQITVAVLAITGKIPVDAECTVEMTNNGNDPEPVWEDATADVKAGRNHPFQNKTQTNGWAFNFRVTVERGGSHEDGYITAIQGGFQ